METIKPLRFVVIGGGVAGIEAATSLSEAYPESEIFLLEQYILLSGSSGRTPGRMGHGFHYANETAFQILESSISFQKKYPNYLVGRDKPFTHPLRHGRYYVTKNSSKSFDQILKFYQKLQAHYAELVDRDPSNQVFGPPHSFFRVLDPSEYCDSVNLDEVVGGIETNEHLFDFQSFANNMRDYFRTHPHVSLAESTEVINLERVFDQNSKNFFYNVYTRSTNNSSFKVYSADFVINSSWQNIEYLNSKLNIPLKDRTNRLKAVVRIRLPVEAYHLHSSFFCMGPFCMFSNLGNGEGLITSAETTNLATSSLVKISNDMEDFIDGRAPQSQRLNIARLILEGVQKYLPSLKEARIIDIRFGIVQTQGLVDIKSLSLPDASHHFRNYLGVREEIQGLISNPAVKLFNAVENGVAVKKLIELQLIRSKINLSLLNDLFVLYPDLSNSLHIYEILLNQLDKILIPINLDATHRQLFLNDFYQIISVHEYSDFSNLSISYIDNQLRVTYKSDSETLDINIDDQTDIECESAAYSFEDKHEILSLTDKEVSKSLETFPVFRPLQADVKEKILAIKLLSNIEQDKELDWQKLIRKEMLHNEAFLDRPGSAIGFFKSNPIEADTKSSFRSISTDEFSGWFSNHSKRTLNGK